MSISGSPAAGPVPGSAVSSGRRGPGIFSLLGFVVFLAVLAGLWLHVDHFLHTRPHPDSSPIAYTIPHLVLALIVWLFVLAEVGVFTRTRRSGRKPSRVFVPLAVALNLGFLGGAVAASLGDRVEVAWRATEAVTGDVLALRRAWHGQVGFLLGLYLGLRLAAGIWGPTRSGEERPAEGPGEHEHRLVASLPRAFARDMEEGRLFFAGFSAAVLGCLRIEVLAGLFEFIFGLGLFVFVLIWLPYFWSHVRWIEFDAERLRYKRLLLSPGQVAWSRVRHARHDRNVYQRWVLTLDDGKVRLSSWPFPDATWARVRTEMTRWLEHAAVPIEDRFERERPSGGAPAAKGASS